MLKLKITLSLRLDIRFSCSRCSPSNFLTWNVFNCCLLTGYFLYWNIIASFAWSTVCCFDYVWIFRSFTFIVTIQTANFDLLKRLYDYRGSFQVSDTCKFIPYSIFGWGVPTVFVSIASVAQFQSSEAPVFPPSLNPNIGLTECWFYGT